MPGTGEVAWQPHCGSWTYNPAMSGHLTTGRSLANHSLTTNFTYTINDFGYFFNRLHVLYGSDARFESTWVHPKCGCHPTACKECQGRVKCACQSCLLAPLLSPALVTWFNNIITHLDRVLLKHEFSINSDLKFRQRIQCIFVSIPVKYLMLRY